MTTARTSGRGRLLARRGFTLVELMVVVAVAAILATLAVPSFQELIIDSRATARSNEVLFTLQLARSEAIKRNANVVVCASADESTCSGTNSWQSGWIVFVDADSDGIRTSTGSSPELLLRTQGALDANTTLTTDVPRLIYVPGGYLSPSTARSLALTVSGSTAQRQICLTAIGKAEVRKEAC